MLNPSTRRRLYASLQLRLAYHPRSHTLNAGASIGSGPRRVGGATDPLHQRYCMSQRCSSSVADRMSDEPARGEPQGATPTPRSSAPCRDSGRPWAPGCSASSGTTRTALPTPSLARMTPAPHPSPEHPANNRSSSPRYATGVSPTAASDGRLAPSPPAPAPAPTTTTAAPPATPPTTPPSDPSPTAWSASSTDASATPPSATEPRRSGALAALDAFASRDWPSLR